MLGLNKLKRELLSIPGWRTKKRLIVFESDDWGSVRMPSLKVYDKLKSIGIDLESGDSNRYNRFDSLESAEDFKALFDVLSKHQSANGRHPVITAFALVANPDFDRIRQADFENYFYEPITKTYDRYYSNQDVLSCWRDGMINGLISPQFHGREHLNIHLWLEMLKKGEPQTISAFDCGVWGFNNINPAGISYQAAFDFQDYNEIKLHKEVIADGLSLFKNIFNKEASVFVPPNGIIHDSLYFLSKNHGIDFMFSSRRNLIPTGNGKYEARLNFLGKKNNAGQYFIIRNAFFEPSQHKSDCVNECISQIETAFRWNKPAIISTHRVNFMGGLYPKNRELGLEKLDTLLSIILKRWPEVEFLSTDQLGNLMKFGGDD